MYFLEKICIIVNSEQYSDISLLNYAVINITTGNVRNSLKRIVILKNVIPVNSHIVLTLVLF